jgi:hypothetical protein
MLKNISETKLRAQRLCNYLPHTGDPKDPEARDAFCTNGGFRHNKCRHSIGGCENQ